MDFEAIARAVCARLGLDPDKTIPHPADPLDPNRPPRHGPRWLAVAEQVQRQHAIAAELGAHQ